MRPALNISRLIVGTLFIFSGLVKANDPTGLGYKMQEFFEVWGLHGLEGLTLSLSVIMIVFEIVAGVAVLIGWEFSLFSWLLLVLIVFFTFLTGYAEFSGKIRECGCFGDCIPLTSRQSFIKDLVLLALILFLFLNRKRVSPATRNGWSIGILTSALLLSFGFQAYVLTYLPVVDCLPFSVGSSIPEKMRIPPGAIPDSTAITFIYEKQGKRVEFDANSFPQDFNDSLYRFIDRYDKVVRKGNAQPPIKDFVIKTTDGMDTTMPMLEHPGKSLIVFARTLEVEGSDWNWSKELKSIADTAAAKGIPIAWVTADADRITEGMHKYGLTGIPVLKGDAVAIKTAARVNPTIYLLQKGTILGKWSYARFDEVIASLK